MKPTLQERSIETNGVMTQSVFGISEKDQSHILSILRDRLYTNKVAAVLREYATNAWDAHVEAGKADLPIKITLPTVLEPTLSIRDFGKGLSEEDIFEVYVKYGASTKRDSNEQVGMLGIGAKSAFAYSDSFTITSHHGGMKKVYAAVLDPSNVGIVTKLDEEPSNETGVEILVPVLVKDIPRFEAEARSLYGFFNPQPKINTRLMAPIKGATEHGFILRQRHEGMPYPWMAVMGCVPYRINMDVVKADIEAAGLDVLVQRLTGGLYFQIGEVSVSANREELEYKPNTMTAIVDKLSALNLHVLQEMEKTVMARPEPWNRYLELQKFIQDTGIKVPDHMLGMAKKVINGVTLYGYVTEETKNLSGDIIASTKTRESKSFTLNALEVSQNNRRRTTYRAVESPHIAINPGSCIYINDTIHSPGHHDIPERRTEGMRVVRVASPIRNKDTTHTESIKATELELAELIEKRELTGIKVEMLSKYPYVPPEASHGGYPDKYKGQTFIWNGRHSSTGSTNWEKSDHKVGPDDVYTILYAFHPTGGRPLYQITQDKDLIEFLGGTFPTLYGLRDTSKKPVHRASVPGKFYADWIKPELARLIAASTDMADLVLASQWVGARSALRNLESDIARWTQVLYEEHPIVVFLTRVKKANDLLSKKGAASALEKIREIIPTPKTNEAEVAKKALLDKYPLLKLLNGDFHTEAEYSSRANNYVTAPVTKEWAKYIRMIDGRKPRRRRTDVQQSQKAVEEEAIQVPVVTAPAKQEEALPEAEEPSGFQEEISVSEEVPPLFEDEGFFAFEAVVPDTEEAASGIEES